MGNIAKARTFLKEAKPMKEKRIERLLRVTEISERTGLPAASVRKMIFLKQLPVVRIGRRVAVPESAIDALISDNLEPAGNDHR